MNNMVCWSCRIKSSWWQFADFTGLIIRNFFFLPGVNVRCKVLKVSWEGGTCSTLPTLELIPSLHFFFPKHRMVPALKSKREIHSLKVSMPELILQADFLHQPVISYQNGRRFHGGGEKSLNNRAWETFHFSPHSLDVNFFCNSSIIYFKIGSAGLDTLDSAS